MKNIKIRHLWENKTSHKSLLYKVDDKPPFLLALFLGIQHVLLLFGGTIMLPIIIAKAARIPQEQIEFIVFATILISAIATVIQIRKTGPVGSGYMLFMGSSGAYLTASIAAAKLGGFALVGAMTILSAPVEILCAYFIRHIRKIVNQAVGGIVIMLIAISIIPIAMQLWVGNPSIPGYSPVAYLIVGLITIITTIFFAVFFGSYIRLWSPIIGIFFGSFASYLFGIIDLSPLKSHAFLGLPKGAWPGLTIGFSSEHIFLFIIFIFATLASTIESIGDNFAIQKISDPDFKKINYDSVQGCLYADGIGNMLAGLLGTVSNTTYSGNIAVIELTGVASRNVGILGAIFMGILAFFPKIAYFFAYIPGPVLGGSTLIFIGLLLISGIKLISSSEIDYETGLLVGISLAVGIISTFNLFFPMTVSESMKAFVNNGVATGGLTAILLNVLFYLRPRKSFSLKLDYDIKKVSDLTTFIETMKAPFRLTQKGLFVLQLTCEEVFSYICTTNMTKEFQGSIKFKWIYQEDYIQVNVVDQSKIQDIDGIEKETKPEKIDQEYIKKLGLVLLNKLAKDVTHYRISGYNCIQFNVPKE